MQKAKRLKLSNWGNFPVIETNVYRPEKERDISDALLRELPTTIARGAGKSYGDSSLNTDSVVSFERLNKFTNFDIDNGTISCQAGVTLAEILNIVIPKGWFLPVIPGTKLITLGGAIAGNVHGKNHLINGDFCEHIEELKLILPEGQEITCSPKENYEIFMATCSGMGMTGIIKEATIRLKAIETISLKTTTKKVSNISEMLKAFREASNNSEYMVGWIDHFGKGNELGRGYFESATHAKIGEGKILSAYKTGKPIISVPKIFPASLLNKYSIQLYNKLKFFNIKKSASNKIKDFSGFFHPLDSIKNWNRLYGKRGFLQYQFVIPDNTQCVDNLKKILEVIQQNGFFSYLAVIKYHRDGKYMMAFPIKGFSVALDFKVNPAILQFLNNLDDIIAKLGGKVYLAKDSRLSPDNFEKMYWNNLPKWKRILQTIDPSKIFISEMARRLRFKNYV